MIFTVKLGEQLLFIVVFDAFYVFSLSMMELLINQSSRYEETLSCQGIFWVEFHTTSSPVAFV